MKRLITLLICFTLFCCFTGCRLGKQNKDVVDKNFYCKVIDENNIAIGNLKTYPKSGAVFFPEKIENYTVSELGFNSGLGFGGNGYFHMSDQNGTVIRRCYFPRSIKEIGSGYMYLTSGNLQIFYCGEIVDLNNFNADEKVKNTSLFHIARKEYHGELIPPESDDFTSTDNLFNYQAKIIRDLAKEESCVIIGRCADYVLKDYPNVLSVFIHAPKEYCLEGAAKKHSMSPKELERFINKTDKHRAEYYKYHTGREWTDARNYDLCLDSSKLGYERCVDEIISYMKVRFPEE